MIFGLAIGIIFALFYKTIGRWTVEVNEEDFPFRFPTLPVIVHQVMILVGGIGVIVYTLSVLLELSPYAAISLFFGLTLTRLFSVLGSYITYKIKDLFNLTIHQFVFQVIVITVGILLIIISLF